MRRWALSAVLLSSGCVTIPEYDYPGPGAPRSTTLTTGVFRDLDPGAKEESGLHFKVKAYGSTRAREILEQAEAQYQRIMNDSGLYSFSPRGLYEIVVYLNQDEFYKKTQFANWAAGVTVGNAIYVYDGPGLMPTLAHEMTHVIFHEYMRDTRTDLRWLNEGFAMYEESRALGGPGVTWPGSQEPFPFDQMTGLVPATERERQVNLWYKQVGDLVGFMVERGGRVGMGQMFGILQNRGGIDEALRTGFPGVWTSMRDLEAAWRRKVSDAGR
ncbi:MAG: hypothetical protein HY925_11540 [Elusimicrobia bacterium]|nr:hypothetical protein [Elusimicrobiota bacterium]